MKQLTEAFGPDRRPKKFLSHDSEGIHPAGSPCHCRLLVWSLVLPYLERGRASLVGKEKIEVTAKKEKPKLSGPAALWAEAMLAQDGVAAAELMQDNPREIASGLIAVPGEWDKWSDVAIRALIPTMGPMTNLFDDFKLLMAIKRELFVFGNADVAVMAMYDQVAEPETSAAKVFGEAYKTPQADRGLGAGACRDGHTRLRTPA